MSERAKADDMAHRLVEAASWHMRLHEADAETSPEFEAWMSVPTNADAWAQTVAIWGFLGETAREPEMVLAREEALGAARKLLAKRRPFVLTRQRGMTAAAIAILFVGLGWGTLRWLERPSDYVTAFGERRIVTLADGSRISLDSDSEVTVDYSQHARELHLLHGQARFDVAHDVERPFAVRAGDRKVIATGTAFNIDMTQGTVLVTLIEGHVVVLDEGNAAPPAPGRPPNVLRPLVQLNPGQQLVVLRDNEPRIEAANVRRVMAWVSGQLIFSDEPLAEVVTRVSHYSKTPIVIDDPTIGGERISGVFDTGDIPGFLDIVTHYYSISAVTDDQGRIILRKL